MDGMVAFSVANCTREAFGGDLPSWAKYDYIAELPGAVVPVKAIAGENDPALGGGDDAARAGSKNYPDVSWTSRPTAGTTRCTRRRSGTMTSDREHPPTL